MFSQSRQVNVNGGTFLAIEGDYNSNVQVQRRSGIDILLEGISQGALHNSGERFDPPKCHPNTRTTLLRKIMDWIQDQDPSSPDFMWIYGPAGSGKSAIAQTIAELCFELGLLLGTFFFSRSVAGRNDDKRLVATIAYQIALSFSEARPLIEKAVEHDPALLSRDLEAQLKALIIEPLSALASDNLRRPHLIIVDGLDECQDPRAQTAIIRTFTRLVTHHKLPFAILFASRTEYHIREEFGDKSFETNLCRIALDNTLWSADDDIREFLTSRFKKIRDTHQMRFYIPQIWPSHAAIEELVERSSGQFIYASTVIKYVEAHGQRPTDRFDAILGLQTIKNGTPFAELDNLYLHILSSVEDYDLVARILGFLLQPSHDSYFMEQTSNFIDQFFLLPQGSVYLALSNLHSILSIPEPTHAHSTIDMHHASFGDFLFDHSRSGIYFLEPSRVHADLAIQCIQTIAECRSQTAKRSTFDLWEDSIEHSVYNHSLQALLEHCSRAYLKLDLVEHLSSFDFLAYMNSSLILQSLPPYFTWLHSQTALGAQEVLKHHLEVFDQCLLFEIRENHYSENMIWGYIIFEGHLSLEMSWFLLGEPGTPKPFPYVPKKTLFVPPSYFDDYSWDYSNFLRQFFFDAGRAGKYAMTDDTHARTMILLLERLRSGLTWEEFDSEHHVDSDDIESPIGDLGHTLPLLLLHAPLSNDLFKCVSSILSEPEREHGSLADRPNVQAALSDYLKMSRRSFLFDFDQFLQLANDNKIIFSVEVS